MNSTGGAKRARVADRSRWRAVAVALAPAGALWLVQLVAFPMPVGAVISGVIVGLLGALGAVGLALVWRSNKVVNFAQGDLGAFPATLAVLLILLAGLPYVLGLTLGLAAALLTGLLADLLVIRRFFRSPRLILTVATIGLSQVLAFASLLLPRAWGEGPAIRSIPPPFTLDLTVGGVAFDANDLIALVVAPVVIAAVGVTLRYTEVGIAIRASAERPDRAAMLGIPVRILEAQVWTAAAVLSFVSIFLTAGVSNLPFGPMLAIGFLVRGLAALVIGRMTNLVAIVGAAIALGVLEAGVNWNTGDAYLMPPILAAVIVVALLLQRRGTSRADAVDTTGEVAAEPRPVSAAVARLPEVRAARVLTWVLVAAVAIGVPPLLGTNGQLKAGVLVVFAMIGTSVVVLTGWAGQVSLGQMTFVGVGGAVGAWCFVEAGWDPIVAMLLAGIAGAVVAVVVGLPALRLRGLYLAVVTLSLSVAASSWVFSNKAVDWIPTGSFRRPDLLGRVSLDTPLRLYYFTLVMLALCLWVLTGLRRSRTGRVLIALRDNEAAAAAYGISPMRAKLSAFALSGFVAAVSGVVLVIHQGAFRDVAYGADESIAVFVATVIGGLGSLGGAVFGALYQRGAQWLLPAPWSALATGLGVLVILLSMPDGLGGLVFRLRDDLLRWAARRHGVHDPSLDRSDAEAASDDVLGADLSDPGAVEGDPRPGGRESGAEAEEETVGGPT